MYHQNHKSLQYMKPCAIFRLSCSTVSSQLACGILACDPRPYNCVYQQRCKRFAFVVNVTRLAASSLVRSVYDTRNGPHPRWTMRRSSVTASESAP